MSEDASPDTGTTQAAPFTPGFIFARHFKLVRSFTPGGMGIVWQAVDLRHNREIALKFVLSGLQQGALLPPSQEDLAALRSEFARVIDLHHTNIVRVYDFVEDDISQVTFGAISMEYIRGETLFQLKNRQPSKRFDVDARFINWIRQIVAALRYAHRSGKAVIHRDLKPHNVMLDEDGTIRLLDFGIAVRTANTLSLRRTEGHPSGTLSYMGPQQLLGERASIKDNIYSFGATLYDLLSGRPPFFRGSIETQILSAEPPPVSSRRRELERESASVPAGTAEIPEHWEKTIMLCLNKDAERRPADFEEVERLLQLDRSEKSRTDHIKHPPNLGTDDRSSRKGFAPRCREFVTTTFARPAASVAFAALMLWVLSLLLPAVAFDSEKMWRRGENNPRGNVLLGPSLVSAPERACAFWMLDRLKPGRKNPGVPHTGWMVATQSAAAWIGWRPLALFAGLSSAGGIVFLLFTLGNLLTATCVVRRRIGRWSAYAGAATLFACSAGVLTLESLLVSWSPRVGFWFWQAALWTAGTAYVVKGIKSEHRRLSKLAVPIAVIAIVGSSVWIQSIDQIRRVELAKQEAEARKAPTNGGSPDTSSQSQ